MDIATKRQGLGQTLVFGASTGLRSTFKLSALLKLMLAASIALLSSMASAANLTDVEFSSKQGGKFQVRLDFDAPPPEPKGYNIEKPARIALDFDGVSSQIKKKKHTLSFGNANSAIILESGGRTRMILNLVELAPFTTHREGNSLFVEVGDSGAREYLKPTPQDSVVAAITEPKINNAENEILGVDFRRGDQGEGRLLISLKNPKTDINVFVEGEQIKVDFKGARIPEKLQRRYDVSDFATPIQQVDAAANERGSIFSLKAIGEYDYLAYQTDNEYVISVKPLTKDEVKKRQKEFAYVGEKLSLNFQDIDVRAVLQLIADFTGLNLVASDTVSGRITLRLQNVPWDQALELVLKTKGLDQRKVGNVLMVAPAAEIAERERQEIANNKQIEELAPLQTEHVRIRYADAKDLFDLFSKGGGESDGEQKGGMLSERGEIIVDERTNSLLITETSQKLDEFRRVIKLLDVPIRQVLIEARIVIANSDFDEQLGIEWGGVFESDVNNGRRVIGGGSSSSFSELKEGGTLETANFGDALAVDLGVGGPTGSFSLGYIGADVALAFELSALETQGRGEIVSQPKVITGDKQEAVIKSGTEVPYQQSSGNGETTVTFKEAVLKLEVTPSITPDDRIIMDLNITQDSVGDLVPSGEGGFIPTIDTTELETQVLVGNGETVVLGGVFRTEDVKSVAKVPFLGDIPYLGRLFKQTSVRQVKAETLIFITPRILADTLVD